MAKIKLSSKIPNLDSDELQFSFEDTPERYAIGSLLTILRVKNNAEAGISITYVDSYRSKQIIANILENSAALPKQHTNSYFSLEYVLNGEVEISVENETFSLKQGDCLFFDTEVKSSWGKGSIDSELLSVAFSRDFIRYWPATFERGLIKSSKILDFMGRNIEKGQKEYILCKSIADEYTQAAHLCEQIQVQLTNHEPGYSMILYGLLTRLFTLLQDKTAYTLAVCKCNVHDTLLTAKIIREYLDRHPQRISLTDLAQVFSYSESHISRLFRNAYHESVAQYNKKVYLKEARRLLIETDDSISIIMQSLNVTNKTQFYAYFKKQFDCTPAELREHFHASVQSPPL